MVHSFHVDSIRGFSFFRINGRLRQFVNVVIAVLREHRDGVGAGLLDGGLGQPVARRVVSITGAAGQRPSVVQHTQQTRESVVTVRRVHAIGARQGSPPPQGVIPETKTPRIGIRKPGQAIQRVIAVTGRIARGIGQTVADRSHASRTGTASRFFPVGY